jgi:predicted RNA-binding protein associated with RNAse of E/G family
MFYATDKYRFIGTKDYGINNNFVRFKNWDIIKDIYIDIPKNTVDANRIEKEFYAEKYIDLLAFTSENEQTRIFTDDQSFISFDTNHWTKSGAKYIGKFLIEELNLLNRE